jgi:tRNA (guanine37-N1)-methyltransferase
MTKPWTANILTLFPEMFPGPLAHAIAGKSLQKKNWEINVIDIRSFAEDKHKTVDDTPFGGGVGMVLKPDVLGKALDSLEVKKTRKIYLSPRGQKFTQEHAKKWVSESEVTLVCGHYEGIDQRVIDYYELEEVSLGDFILSGGEVAALTVLDACIRLVPGVLLKQESIANESFEGFLLEHPHYTRPQMWRGLKVPEVLLSGHHKKIQAWRREQSENLTKIRRPDLWASYQKYGMV